MSFKGQFSRYLHSTTFLLGASVFALSGCGGDSGGSSGIGYVKFYNASSNSPALFLTIDADLEDDSDDELEITFNGIEYTKALTNYEVETDDYFYELAWQDEDSTDRDDLELVFEGSIAVEKDMIQLIVASDNIVAPQVDIYSIEVIDDDDDTDDDLFNLRILNMHPDNAGIEIYLSKSDETINEAVLIGQYATDELSDNQKFDQDEYVFYIKTVGSDEVLYTSSDIDYAYPSQYIMVVRENTGSGTSPYAIDRVSSSSTVEYLDAESSAKFRAYNAIQSHDLIADYQDNFDLYVDGIDDEPEIAALELGQFSATQTVDKGDYSLDLIIPETQGALLSNHLLTLAENTNKTVFFYLNEEDVDHDGDGDVDENDDGIVDEIEVTIHSLVVDNSTRESIYDHEIKMINLVDSDEFTLVKFYFVRSDETIETALYNRNAVYAQPESINLLNNTYQVFAVAEEDSSEIILSSFELVLDEDSNELFLVVEDDADSPTGYRIEMIKQTDDE
jgi:hypothetical protein